MSCLHRALGTLCAIVLTFGCGKSTTSPSGTAGSGGSNPPSTGAPAITDADLNFCVTETNRYRAMRSRPPLSRSSQLEAYAAEGARIDQQANRPHQHFTSANGAGVASAENEQTLAADSSVSTQSAIASMIFR